MFAPMTGLRAFLRDIGSVLAIGSGSALRERVRRSHDDREAQASDREALAGDFEHVGRDLCRALVAGEYFAICCPCRCQRHAVQTKTA